MSRGHRDLWEYAMQMASHAREYHEKDDMRSWLRLARSVRLRRE